MTEFMHRWTHSQNASSPKEAFSALHSPLKASPPPSECTSITLSAFLHFSCLLETSPPSPCSAMAADRQGESLISIRAVGQVLAMSSAVTSHAWLGTPDTPTVNSRRAWRENQCHPSLHSPSCQSHNRPMSGLPESPTQGKLSPSSVNGVPGAASSTLRSSG